MDLVWICIIAGLVAAGVVVFFVRYVLKQDQGTGPVTEGIVERILTKSAFHPHGIKVKLSSGQVGRVKEIHN